MATSDSALGKPGKGKQGEGPVSLQYSEKLSDAENICINLVKNNLLESCCSSHLNHTDQDCIEIKIPSYPFKKLSAVF